MWPSSCFRLCVGLALLAGSAAAAPSARVNGWYPCAFSTETDKSYGTSFKDMTVFECAELEVPLCYDGVCESDRMINLFVKRRLAVKPTKDENAPRKALILIQGGPGYASPVMEYSMIGVLDETIDYYTFDHRGTGRSEYLQCDAAQALTAGSPNGKSLSLDELQSCLQDINFQYDGQAAAFSTTSAAMDVQTLIETFLAKQHVYVAGYSYGTFLTQRILQLQLPQVRGYIFDSVDVITTKKDPFESANSHWNQALVAPVRRLLEYCFDDKKCPITFKSRDTVLPEMLAVVDALDGQVRSSECAKIIVQGVGYEQPSVGFRTWFSEKMGIEDRVLALKALGHLQRCGTDDVKALRSIFLGETESTESTEAEASIPDTLNDSSDLLYNVIVFSERYSEPSPTKAERDEFFFSGLASSDDTSAAREYCVFTGADDEACKEFGDELPKGNQTFWYEHDKYFEAPLQLPAHASALIFNGGLDFATPLEFGELLYKKLGNSGKGTMMVNFDYGTHCNGELVAESQGKPCRDKILAEFVAKDGDVTEVDTNCMETLPGTSFGY